jgi:hypothetical protein
MNEGLRKEMFYQVNAIEGPTLNASAIGKSLQPIGVNWIKLAKKNKNGQAKVNWMTMDYRPPVVSGLMEPVSLLIVPVSLPIVASFIILKESSILKESAVV